MSDTQLTIPGFTMQPADGSLPVEYWLYYRVPRTGLIPGLPIVRDVEGNTYAYLDLIRMVDPDNPDAVWTLTVKRTMSYWAACLSCDEHIPVSRLCASGPDVYVCLDCVLPIERYRYAPLGLKS